MAAVKALYFASGVILTLLCKSGEEKKQLFILPFVDLYLCAPRHPACYSYCCQHGANFYTSINNDHHCLRFHMGLVLVIKVLMILLWAGLPINLSVRSYAARLLDLNNQRVTLHHIWMCINPHVVFAYKFIVVAMIDIVYSMGFRVQRITLL